MNQDNNKLIASFMGMEQGIIIDCIGYYSSDELEYNTDWNSLMRVIDKIEAIENNYFEVIIEFRNTWIKDKRFEPKLTKPICSAGGKEKITPTYKAVVDFINWYNHFNKDQQA